MSIFNVATRYANALIELASEKDIFSEVSLDIELVYKTLKDSRELRRFLENPIIKSDIKINVLEELFKERVSGDTQYFLNFVVKKNRVDILFDIVKRFTELRDQKLGFVNVQITSSIDLEESQKEIIKKRLEDYTKKKVRLEYNIDEKIIGGFIAKVGDQIIDASVLHQLNQLKKRFTQESISIK